MNNKIVYLVAIVCLVFGVSMIFLDVQPSDNYLDELCDADIQPQSFLKIDLEYTKATPNHKRPCSMPILFGGDE